MYDPSSSKSHSATFTLPEFRKSCWVPSCANIENINYSKTFYPLPTSSLLREIWLARAGRPVGLSTDKIYFCEEHFRHEDLLSYALRGTTFMPCYKMSQVICRMCMSIVPEAEPYHVLSNTIPTDIPTELKNTLKLAILITPEPLQNIVKFCMPELTIQTDPIPLICQNCFKRLWKFFLFKTTCIEVDKSLRGDLPVATYGKMVLCRACPQTFGTNFIILVEQTNLGMFLMNMFLTKYSSKIVPLRLCKSCYEILEDLLEFQLNCHTVEEKMKRHIALTQNQPIIRTQALSSSESAHTSIWDTRDIYSNERPQIGDITDDSSVSTNGNIFIMWKRVEFIKAMIKHGLPLRYKVDRDLKDEIWRKISEELQTKGVICNIVGLKSVWLTMMADIQKALNRNQSLNESQSLMIQYLKVDEQAGHLSRNNIYENATVGSTLDLDNGRDHLESQPCPQTQLPLFVEGNISTSVDRYEQETHSDPKINLQILQKNASSARNVTIQPTINFDSYQNFRTLAHNETIANPSIDEMIKSSDNKKIFSSTQGNDRSENYSIGTSVSTKSRKANKLSNILKPDINKIKIPIPEIVNMPINNITALSSVSGNNSRKSEMETGDIIFSNEEQLDLLEIMKVEYKLYLEEVGKVYTKLPFKEILSRIIKRYKKYEKYSFITIYNCWKSMKKSSLECKNDCMKTALQQEILEFLEFQRQHSQKKVRSKMLKTKRSNFSYKKSNDQDKLDLVEAVQREYDALREDEFSVRSIWKKLIENVHRKGFKCWSFEKILSLWGRLKISAVVHEKNSGDLVDEKVWKLLQQYNMDKKRIRNNTESKNVSGNQDEINIKNNIRQDKSDNQTDRELVNIDVDLNKNNVDLAHSVNIQNERVITKEQQAQKGQDFVNPSSKTNVKLDKRKFNMGRSSAKETVYELSLKRKLHFLNEIEQEYDKTPAPWKDILNRLYKKQYKCWDKTKIISVWKQLKASSRAHEEKDADIADKKTWDLLQKYSKAQNKLTNSNKSSGREFSTIKHTREYLGKEEMPQMIDVNKKSDGKKFHKFSEVEKMSLFKNIKKEYYTMVNNKEQNLSRPWKTVIHRVQEKYYKNILSESKVLSEWSKIRKSAALHENTSSMSQVDWKVVRLMKFANKMKDFKTNSKKENSHQILSNRKIVQQDKKIGDIPNNGDDKIREKKKEYGDIPNNGDDKIRKKRKEYVDISNNGDDNIRKKRKECVDISNNGDDKIRKMRKEYVEIPNNGDDKIRKKKKEHVDIPNNGDDKIGEKKKEYVIPNNGDDKIREKKNEYVDWCYKKKLDLITTVTNYGREVFKKTPNEKNDKFWMKITRDFHIIGYKYSEESLRQHWEELQGSANMAWADQKIATELDEMIIEFMKNVIKLKQGCIETNEEEENIEIKELPIAGTSNQCYSHTEQNNHVDEQESGNGDDDMLEEMNDGYVSLADIKNFIPDISDSNIVELSSDDETVINFDIRSEDIKNVEIMTEESKIAVEKEEIERVKSLLEKVGVIKETGIHKNVKSENESYTGNKSGMIQTSMVEDSSVIIIDSDDE